MSTTRFAPDTKFNTSRSSSMKSNGPLFGNQSMMSISELGIGNNRLNSVQEETLETLSQIGETKASISVLIEKTKSYSKNSGSYYKDVLTPKSKKKTYQRSPYGEILHISDYSCFCTPTRKEY